MDCDTLALAARYYRVESLEASSITVNDVASTIERQYKQMAIHCKDLEAQLASVQRQLELVQLESDRKTEKIKVLER